MTEGDGLQDLTQWARRSRWLLALIGAVSVIAGVIVLAEPSISLATLALVTGVFMLVDGVGEVVVSLLRRTDQRALGAIVGALSAVVGILLIRDPIRGVVAVALLLGLWLVVSGIARLIGSIAEERRVSWMALVAVVELAAGIIIVSVPAIGVVALALIVGIGLIARGLALIVLAWAVRRVAQAAGDDVRGESSRGAVTAT